MRKSHGSRSFSLDSSPAANHAADTTSRLHLPKNLRQTIQLLLQEKKTGIAFPNPGKRGRHSGSWEYLPMLCGSPLEMYLALLIPAKPQHGLGHRIQQKKENNCFN